MRLLLALGLGFSALYGQTCVPGTLLPAGQVTGTLDQSSCQLPDGTSYAAYRLNLAVRGQAQIALNPGSAKLGLMLQDGTGAQLAAGLSIQRPLEAGGYTVLVNGQQPGQVGPYTIQTSLTPEPGMLCTSFPSLGISQTVTGTLGASGCKAPDGTPFEAWWLTTFGSGTLTLSATSTSFTPVVSVRTDDGSLLASAQGSVQVMVDAGTTYQVVVSTADTAGAYQIATSFQPDPLDTCSVKKALGAPDSDQTSIDGNSCSMVVDAMGNLAYYNFYSFTVTSAGLVDVSAASTDFPPTLYLLDAAGNQLAVDSLGGGPNQAEIRMQLAPGDYTVQVVSNLISGGTYTLSDAFTPGVPQPCPLTAATAGNAAAGTLSASSCRTALGLADLYSIALPSAGQLSVSLAAATFTGRVALRDAKDNFIVMAEDDEGLGVSQISALVPAGNYTVLAGAVTGSGSYLLTPGFTAQAIPACTQIPQLSLGVGYVQNLGVPGCTGTDGQPVDWYQFTLAADSVIAATMTANEVVGFLTLTDANGSFLRSDRDSYACNDPLIVQFLPAGTYQLAARAANGAGAGGIYLISLLGQPEPRPPFCAPLGNLALGNSVTATLTFTSCQYIDNTFADLYQVVLTADTAIDLRLSSSDFDAYLLVLDAKGNVVAQDDDSGGGTNSRIVQTLPAGTYTVVAKPFSAYYSVGAYTLSLLHPAQE